MAKPTARVVSEVCSLCGLDWKLHGKDPTAETCVSLLLDEVRSLNSQLAHRPLVRPLPYPVPAWTRPYWGPFYSISAQSSTAQLPQYGQVYNTPASGAVPRAITSRSTA